MVLCEQSVRAQSESCSTSQVFSFQSTVTLPNYQEISMSYIISAFSLKLEEFFLKCKL